MYQNRVHLIGYLGKNPEHESVKTTDRKYAVLSLATQRSWKGADEDGIPKRSGIASSRGTASASTPLLSCARATVYVEDTLVSSTYQKEFGEARTRSPCRSKIGR